MGSANPSSHDHPRPDRGFSSSAPAPPGYVPEAGTSADPWTLDPVVKPASPRKERPGLRPFAADIDVAELGEQLRPIATWQARSRALSRSTLVISSRRMVHLSRVMIIAVHMIDSEPVPLLGKVAECEYEGYALHRIILDLLPMPESPVLTQWLRACAA